MTIKGHFKKLEKLAFSQRGLPTILVKHLEFLGCVFFYRTCLYILFDKVLEKKTSLSRVKKRPSSKVENISIFAEGLLLVKNLKFIGCVIFHRIGQEILFDNMLGIKQVFLGYENDIKKIEKLAFSILVKNF